MKLKGFEINTKPTYFHPRFSIDSAKITTGKSVLNPCETDTEWNSRGIPDNLAFWLRSLSDLHHYRGLLHLPLSTERLLVLQFFEQAVPQLQFVSAAANFTLELTTPSWVGGAPSQEGEFINGFFYGTLHSNGSITGDDYSFVFPDFRTVLRGSFVNGVMISALPAKILAERCLGGLKQLKISKPGETVEPYYFAALSSIAPGAQPTLMDPLERRNVYVRESPGRGLGIYAKRKIRAGELVSYFAGVIVDVNDYNNAFTNQTNLADRERVSKYAVMLFTNVSLLDVPPAYEGLHRFRATLGHLVNHSFKQNNAEFVLVTHPRFGYVRALLALRAIERGEEILVNYRYEPGSPASPEWYNALHKREMEAEVEAPTSA